MQNVAVVSLLFIWCLKLASADNILFVSAIPSPSNHLFNRALAFALAEKGHKVTFAGSNEEKEKHPNLEYILFDGAYAFEEESNVIEIIGMSKFEAIRDMYKWSDDACINFLKSNGLKKIMSFPDSYKMDLIIFDVTINQCLYPLIDKFNRPPVVAISAFVYPYFLAVPMGAHVFPSYYPYFSLEATNHMSFKERALSFILTIYELYHRATFYAESQEKKMKEYFGENSRTMKEYESEIGIFLANVNPYVDYPISLPPNIIPVGGMHVKPPKPLPKDLQDIMDNAKHGVILFSLGTNIQSNLLSQEAKNELLAAFSKLRETVIWKYDGELENKPKNVFLRKWLPQNDVLGHKNCKLFISHAGGLSSQEALYHAVPVVAIPGFADQSKIAHRLLTKGFGLTLDFHKLNRDNIYEAITTVISNPSFKENIKALSKKFHDQPQTSLERAVFWTEYVLRHKNVSELELPSRRMCPFVVYSVDVISCIIGIPLAIIFLLYVAVFKICLRKKSNDTKNNETKNVKKVKKH